MPALSPLYRRFIVLLPLVLLLVSGCASQAQTKKTLLWQSREQFVALVDRDDQGGQQNRHPASLSGASLRSALAPLKVRVPGSNNPVQLFGEPELKLLGEEIPAALQQARPDQDIVFAVYGRAPILKGYAFQEVVTTGRVFFQDNGLNLILGMVRETIKESDRRLQPFVPGSRTQASPLPGTLSTSSEAARRPLPNRPDWVVLSLREEPMDQAPAPQAVQEEQSPVKDEAATPPPAQEASAVESQPSAPLVVKEPSKGGRSIEERLRTLAELKAKGLITEEEYRLKKESILGEL